MCSEEEQENQKNIYSEGAQRARDGGFAMHSKVFLILLFFAFVVVPNGVKNRKSTSEIQRRSV